MSQNRLDHIYEGERSSLMRLDQMVKDEEKKIEELKKSVSSENRTNKVTSVKNHKIMIKHYFFEILPHNLLIRKSSNCMFF